MAGEREHAVGGDVERRVELRAEQRPRAMEARVELVERGELPRFAYKAARVVDEG